MPADRVTLRTASAADGPAIADLFLAARREAMPYLPRLHSDDETREWIADVLPARCIVWVAVTAGRIAGFLALHGDFVEHLYVRPELQGQGIGGRLLAKAKELNPGGLRLFAFEKNTRARAFYENRGFVATAFGDGSENEENEPDVLYEWTGTASLHRSE